MANSIPFCLQLTRRRVVVSVDVIGVVAHGEQPIRPGVHVHGGDGDAEDVQKNATRDLKNGTCNAKVACRRSAAGFGHFDNTE